MIVIIVFLCMGLFVGVIVALIYGSIWLQAYMAGADVTIWSLVGMGLRKVKPDWIFPGTMESVPNDWRHTPWPAGT